MAKINQKKYKNAVLFFAKKIQNGTLGKLKMMKLLYFLDFDLNVFEKEELLMLQEIASKWEKFTGTEMKNASHGEAPWIATKPDNVIDYNLALYRNKYGEMAKV